MLRINLLPPYVAQRRLNKRISAAWIVAFAAIAAGILAFQFVYLVPLKDRATKNAVTAKSDYDNITMLNGQATTITASVQPITDKINFYTAAKAYNLKYIMLYNTVAKYTSPKILYTGLAVAGTTLTINAYTPSLEELGRYMQIMSHEPDISAVSINSIPTPDQAAETIYEYKGQVIGMTGGAASTSTSGGGSSSMSMNRSQGQGYGSQGSSAASGIPGVPSGVNVNLPAGVSLPGSSGSSSSGGYGGGGMGSGGYGSGMGSQMSSGGYGRQSQNGLPAMQSSSSSYSGMSSGMGRMGGMGGSGSMSGQGGQSSGATSAYLAMLIIPDFNWKYWKVIVKRTDGFSFVATCTLKQAFSPPTPPGGGSLPGGTTNGTGPAGGMNMGRMGGIGGRQGG